MAAVFEASIYGISSGGSSTALVVRAAVVALLLELATLVAEKAAIAFPLSVELVTRAAVVAAAVVLPGVAVAGDGSLSGSANNDCRIFRLAAAVV